MGTEKTKRIFADPPPWWDLAPLYTARATYQSWRDAGLSTDEITSAARALGFNGVKLIEDLDLDTPP